jgi:hypothetical protein
MMLTPMELNPLTGTLARRMLGAAMLDRATYEEVTADRGATAQALLVVGLVSAALAIGAGSAFVASLALLAWASWALVTFEVGARLLPESTTHSDVGEMLRTLGFSAAPGVIVAAAVVPFLARPAMVIAGAWMLVSMIVAVRQALDYSSTIRAILVCVVGWILSLTLVLVLGLSWGATAS